MLINFVQTQVPYSVRGLISSGMVDEAGAELIVDALVNKRRILITGPSGSGKTILLNALLSSCKSAFRLGLGLREEEAVPSVPGFRSGEPSALSPTSPLFLDGTLDGLVEGIALGASTFTLPGRSAGGALRNLKTALEGTPGGEEADLRKLVDLVVTCDRRTVRVGGVDYKRRVITDIDAFEGIDEDGRYILTNLYEALQDDDGVVWRKAPAKSGLKEDTNWVEIASLFQSLVILAKASNSASTGVLLASLAGYGGNVGALAADLLKETSELDRRIDEAQKWLLAPLLRLPLKGMDKFSTSDRIALDAIRLAEATSLFERFNPGAYHEALERFAQIATRKRIKLLSPETGLPFDPKPVD